MCGGLGRRFAKSMGNPNEIPYPKHLEKIGRDRILDLSVRSMLKTMPVAGITVILNDRLVDQYMPHLVRLQRKYPSVTMSYAPSPPEPEDDFPTLAKKVFGSEVSLLNQRKVQFDSPVVALGFGDTFCTGDLPKVQKQIMRGYAQLEPGKTLSVWSDSDGRGTLKAFSLIAPYDQFGELYGDFTQVRISPDDMTVWNINKREDLIEAKRALGIPITDAETSYEIQHPRKEYLW